MLNTQDIAHLVKESFLDCPISPDTITSWPKGQAIAVRETFRKRRPIVNNTEISPVTQWFD